MSEVYENKPIKSADSFIFFQISLEILNYNIFVFFNLRNCDVRSAIHKLFHTIKYLNIKQLLTRVPPTVHDTPVKILDMVFFLSPDLYNLALDCNGHHKTVTYFL
jgi:hypothetical protein